MLSLLFRMRVVIEQLKAVSTPQLTVNLMLAKESYNVFSRFWLT